ncbi:prolyl oligopeptidase family serine peptidase [Catenulispora subtropica]|uniref:Prolyl oligopeptidase family serine peptidase n=1 Tax=Catenulispora subtropica TaxID=450798 RepID=A0ABP5D4S2_9ACTN
MTGMADTPSFPRHSARTQRFTLGVPRAFSIAPDGSRIAFLRGKHGTDTATCLWVLDPATGEERLVADPVALLGGAGEELTDEEKARRERSRQGAAGIVGFAVDTEVRTAAFALSGRLFVADLTGGTAPAVRELPVPAGVADPRPNPAGTHVAYVAGGAMRVVGVDGGDDRALAEPESDTVTYGLAEFIAAEEMDRFRGYWWAPEGDRLFAERADSAPIQSWYIADPANPGRTPAEVRYPAAGTDNAKVSGVVLGLDGSRQDVHWEAASPYLTAVHWSSAGDPVLGLMNREQTRVTYALLDPDSGMVTMHSEESDPRWVDIFPGVPAWISGPDDGDVEYSASLVTIGAREGANRLLLDGEPLTPPELQVRAVLSVGEHGVQFTASADDPAEVHVFLASRDGVVRQLTETFGVHSAVFGADLAVVSSVVFAEPGTVSRVVRLDEDGDLKDLCTVRNVADVPELKLNATMVRLGGRALRGVLVLPNGHVAGTKLPVLLDPYGGPHAQRALAAHNSHLASQWLADQGFAVLVVDGRGTPGRGPEWDRAIHHDFAGPTLQDQVDALQAAAAENADLDLSRVAIRGWSYGGYLSALAALRRPDVFHAAVVGAPVTDWRLYDTCYTERYLGHPDFEEEVYRRNSIVVGTEPSDWAPQHRPMMVIHGLADDNVVAAHTLRLSSALLAAGRPHEMLPLSGVTHMTPQEVVAENLMLLQVDFLKRTLG